jgi:thiol-disulfide isomerase/thioredoxin
MKHIAFSICCLALTIGCGPAEEPEDPNAIVHEGTCDEAGFAIDMGKAVFGRRGGKRYVGYVAEGSGSRYDKIEFVSYLYDDENTLAVGSYVLSADDGNGANEVLRAYRDCEDDVCNEVYQASGTLKIEASGEVGDQFTARLDNVTFEQMEDDGSEPMRNGSTFCGSAVRWDAPIESNVLGECLTDGEGLEKGDKLRDLVLPNCYGDMISVHDNCGHVKAQVLVLTASWCSACRTRLPATEALIQQYKDQNASVEAYYILGQGSQPGAPATLQECFGDAQTKSIDPARMLVDNGGGRVGFNEMFRRGFATLCDSGLPNYIVLDGDDMSFDFASRCHVSQTDDGVWREDQWGPQDNRAAAGAGGYTLAIEQLLDD